MHRFYCHSSRIESGRATLEGREAGHAFRVLRLRCGDSVELVDETGTEYRGIIKSAAANNGIIRIDSSHPPPREYVQLTLAAALPKGQIFDDIVDRATQLGISTIMPMITGRTIVRAGKERFALKQQRWQKKALAAVKQCGRASLPAVMPVHSFAQVLALVSSFERGFIGSVQPDAVPLKQALAGGPPESALLLIGPEGDFSPQEYQRAKEAGLTGVSLGKRILRCETAVTALLGIIGYEWNT